MRKVVLGLLIFLALGMAGGVVVFFLSGPAQEAENGAAVEDGKKEESAVPSDFSEIQERERARAVVIEEMKKEKEDTLKGLQQIDREEVAKKKRAEAIDRWLKK